MVDQPSNDFDPNEHGEDASSAAYDAERELMARRKDEDRAGTLARSFYAGKMFERQLKRDALREP